MKIKIQKLLPGFPELEPNVGNRKGQRGSIPIRERPSYRASYCTEACTNAELLAALIRGSKQREIAGALIEQFGGLHSLGKATVTELEEIQGIGKIEAAVLKAAFELGRRLQTPPDKTLTINSPEDAASLLIPMMQHYEEERMVVLLLNTRNRLIGEPIELYKGTINSTPIRIGELLRPGIRANAAAMIVAHNHPSNSPDPSPEDVSITRSIVEAGKLVDLEVLDHLIIGYGNFISLKSKGLGFK